MPYLPPREHGQLCSLGSGPQIANSRRRGEHFSVVPPVRECIFLTSLTARWLCVVLSYFAWFSVYENMSSVYVINPPSKSQRVVQQAVGFRTSSYSIKVCCSTVNHILHKYTYQMEILALQKSVVGLCNIKIVTRLHGHNIQWYLSAITLCFQTCQLLFILRTSSAKTSGYSCMTYCFKIHQKSRLFLTNKTRDEPTNIRILNDLRVWFELFNINRHVLKAPPLSPNLRCSHIRQRCRCELPWFMSS